MSHHLLKCVSCQGYTMKETCCASATVIPRPPKYSPEDKYGGYRRQAKEELTKEAMEQKE
ncbi:MAG: nucleolar RNA-binding Nop10p family protein [Candidatus Woesearchaeota archaeon]|nr:nucleolar RNA-binding Nop10p family protein [Candidatus Woesearchaeota archaeon]